MRALRASSQLAHHRHLPAWPRYCVPRSLPVPDWRAPPDNPPGAPGPAPPAWAPAWCRRPCPPAPAPDSPVTAARPPWPGRHPHAGARCPPGAASSMRHRLLPRPLCPPAPALQTAPASLRPPAPAASTAGPPPARPPAGRSAAQRHPSDWRAACTPHPHAAPGRQSSRTPRRCRPVALPAQSGRHRTDCPARRH